MVKLAESIETNYYQTLLFKISDYISMTGNLYCKHLIKRMNRGIKHDFPFINIRKVQREVLKPEGEARGFQPSRGTLRMIMNDKIMFDRYYCINSTKKHCENDENIGALYFITSPHFPTRVRYARLGPRSSTHNLARALRHAW